MLVFVLVSMLGLVWVLGCCWVVWAPRANWGIRGWWDECAREVSWCAGVQVCWCAGVLTRRKLVHQRKSWVGAGAEAAYTAGYKTSAR